MCGIPERVSTTLGLKQPLVWCQTQVRMALTMEPNKQPLRLGIKSQPQPPFGPVFGGYFFGHKNVKPLEDSGRYVIHIQPYEHTA